MYKSMRVTMPVVGPNSQQGAHVALHIAIKNWSVLTKVGPATLQRPEEVAVCGNIRLDDAPICENHLKVPDIVRSKTVSTREGAISTYDQREFPSHTTTYYVYMVSTFAASCVPPRTRPSTPTWGSRPPTTLTPYVSSSS